VCHVGRNSEKSASLWLSVLKIFNEDTERSLVKIQKGFSEDIERSEDTERSLVKTQKDL
jgi:hypothetical protein